MLKEAEEKVKQIRDRLKTAQTDKIAITIENIERSALNPVIPYTYECLL